ncbi:E3 ubiquitin-protein ligase MIB1-like isoform X1 [Gossypium australe]|uniref:E3 ubiquitin-protein ligase MIB1-like isoform X1 n=1 Tax=Gossypium australe TaxID=47621 RepID=A0A5B6WJ61_9ROSI|nr:E3 ubiquitin-protein ligase MIB1-like isoform X1 [Gossypium australe]
MDENLRKAARTGKVNELYRVIQSNGNVLRHFDEVEFIETPLHIAAEEGCIEFAMEMMNLKPSFARKLNHQGLSPLHIAVRKGHKEMALRFLEIDKHLVHVRGKKGKTPLRYLCKFGNQLGLLDTFLEASPDCIQDVTTENRTALHIAIQNNRLDVLQLLIRTLKRKDYYWEVVNRKDKDGNTALHIAAILNQPKVLKLLLNCKADKHATNQVGLTALGVAQQHNNRENIAILKGCFIPVVSNFKRLLQTATYQATLSPPGSVWQGENTSRSKGSYDATVPGKSVMDFLSFYIQNYLVFLLTFFLTLALRKTLPYGFRTALKMCVDESISVIAPHPFNIRILFSLMVFMCAAYRRFNSGNVECWIFPSILYICLGSEISIGINAFISDGNTLRYPVG